MNIFENNRNQWREIQRKITKGGLPALKAFMHQVHDSAVKSTINTTIDNVKETTLTNVDKALKNLYGFGDKRLGKVREEFDRNWSEDACKEICKKPVEIEERFPTLEEKTSHLVLGYMLDQVHQILDNKDENMELYKDEVIDKELRIVYGALYEAMYRIKTLVNEEHYKQMIDMSKTRQLFLKKFDEKVEGQDTISIPVDKLYDYLMETLGKTCAGCTDACSKKKYKNCAIRKHMIDLNVPIFDPNCKDGKCEYLQRHVAIATKSGKNKKKGGAA